MLKVITCVLLALVKVIAVLAEIGLIGLVMNDHEHKNVCDMVYHGIFLIIICIIRRRSYYIKRIQNL